MVDTRAPEVVVPPPARPPAHRMGPFRRGVRELGLGLITAGVIILLFVTYQLWGTGFAEAHSQSDLKRTFNQHLAQNAPAADTATVGPSLPSAPGAGANAIGHLVIPKIGVDKFVVQGVGEEDLRRGPGHYPQTVMPGELGNSAIAGHRTTYGAPFFRLDELAVGDDILITNAGGRTFRYQVSQTMIVSPNDIKVLDPTADARLTLTTCNPRFSATSRLVVVADLVGLPVPAAVAPTPVAQPAIANLGQGNHGAWPPALAYGAAVLALWIATRILINRTRRWRRLGAYVGGIGITLVPLWFCFENVVRLLPQNI
ncbi:MAG: class E sortase [Acidimicrobiales bacterium]